MPVKTVESEKILWCAFCFDCEGIIHEDPDFWTTLGTAEVHATCSNHLVSLTTWLDRRLREEKAKNDNRITAGTPNSAGR